MKIALCISGYFSNKCGDDLLITNYIYDNVINKIITPDSLDIFIHSFDKSNENKILTKYPNAIIYVIENQIDFTSKINSQYFKYMQEQKYFNYGEYNLQSSLSFLYSRSKCIKLALEYSKENNFDYDCIIRCRFDIGIRLKRPFNGFKPDNFVFNPNLDFSYFYSAYWNQLNAGYCDHWEVSNAKNMDLFSNIYDCVLNDMLILDSEYLKLLNFWLDSDKNNCTSNIIINKNLVTQSMQLFSYEFVHSSNNHLIQKFYMIKCDLYLKSKFLDYTKN